MAEHNPEPELRASAHEPGEPAARGDANDQSARALLDAARTEADQQRATAEEYRTMLQRVQADFVNYKRRVEAERESRADALRAETLLALLPVVDDLERALAHVPATADAPSWAQGFGLIDRNLAAVFERLGVRRVGSPGDLFDPNLHEAVTYEEDPTQPEGHVAAVIRPGYQLGELVVRPAQVSVARAAEGAEPGGDRWSKHQARGGHGNGGVGPADLHRPRDIERADSI